MFPQMRHHRLVERDAPESWVGDKTFGLYALFSPALAAERPTGLNLPFGGPLAIMAARNG